MGGVLLIVILVILVVLMAGVGWGTRGPWQGRGPGMMTGEYGPGDGAGYGPGYCEGNNCPGYGYGNGTGYGPGMMAGWNGQASGAGYGMAYGYGNGTGYGSSVPALLPPDNASPLTDAEIRDILFLREEEQLAHDLYIRWGAIYSLPVFSNIAGAETTHIAQVQLLMTRYGLSENRTGNASAGYYNPEIQSLYDTLGPAGDSSLEGALNGGLAIEVHDIADLDSAIANTSRTDILQVWSNLRQGSLNHKAAFGMMLGT